MLDVNAEIAKCAASAENIQMSPQLMFFAFQYSTEAVLITDVNNRIVQVNQAFTTLTGYNYKDVVGNNPRLLSSGKTDIVTYQDMWRGLQQHGFWQGELWDRHKDGHIYPKWAVIHCIYESGELINYMAHFTDLSARKIAEQETSFLSHFDALTQLPNRLALVKRLQQFILTAYKQQEQLAVFMIDLDGFRSINDQMGHDIGDQVLKQAAFRLKSWLGTKGLVARHGGDKFVLIQSDYDEIGEMFRLAEKIIKSLSVPYFVGRYQFESSCSVGVSVYPTDGESADELIKNAEIAMYAVKNSGRNGYRFFDLVANQLSFNEAKLAAEMKLALDAGEFQLYFQPLLNVISEQVVSVEALLRWEHPRRGWLSPALFIPIAEENSFILSLGNWVLRQACLQLRRFAELGLSIKVNVNLSAKQFLQQDLPLMLARLVVEFDVDPELLELEITESALLQDPNIVSETMMMLRGIGFTLAIDDFGTGYSSLSYLKQFPVSTLKIDRSFVKDIVTNQSDAQICAATVALAHSLGLNVVAEGVETQEQLNYLRNLDCDVIQGYFYSQATSSTALEAFIRQQNGAEGVKRRVGDEVLIIDSNFQACRQIVEALSFVNLDTKVSYQAKQALDIFKASPLRFSVVVLDIILIDMSGVELIQHLRKMNNKLPIVIVSAARQSELDYVFELLEKTSQLVLNHNLFFLEKPILAEDIYTYVLQAKKSFS